MMSERTIRFINGYDRFQIVQPGLFLSIQLIAGEDGVPAARIYLDRSPPRIDLTMDDAKRLYSWLKNFMVGV